MSARREHPAVTAAADQASAAASDVARRVHAGYQLGAAIEALTTGSPPLPAGETAGAPAGPRAKVLEGASRRFTAGEVSACLHAAAAITPGLGGGPRPDALVWLSWWPDLISCPQCALALPDASLEEAYRCDGCGHAGAPGDLLETVSYVVETSAEHAARAGHLPPPLICSFGLCVPCSQASGSEPPGGIP